MAEIHSARTVATTTAPWNHTFPAASWSFTTPSTTTLTSMVQTPHLRSWKPHASQATSQTLQPADQRPGVQPRWSHQPLDLLETTSLQKAATNQLVNSLQPSTSYFGSFDNFKAQFTAAALGIQGSGWAILAYEPIGGNLVIEQFYDQQNGVPVATTPLFMLDMWEHAFYLDYQNVKPDYVKANLWNIVKLGSMSRHVSKAARSGAAGLVKP